MLALVTGASSGIGYEIVKKLSKIGYDVVAVGRNVENLNKLKNECGTCVIIEECDLTVYKNLIRLYEKYKGKNIDILVNSAGIGQIGNFYETNLEDDISLIKLNIIATHVLTKLFLKEMVEKNRGYILNVSSSAAFAPGPLMSTYYSTKAYILKLSKSISKELKKSKSNVIVSTLCPGPVNTNFNNRLNIHFSVKPISSEYVAEYSIKKLFKKKKIIVPGIKTKFGIFFSKIIPEFILEEYIYIMQKNKF